MKNENTGIRKYVNPVAFFPPAILLVIAAVIGLLFPEKLNTATSAALGFTVTNFSWFYTLGMILLIAFCLFIAFSKAGNVKLGGPDAKPSMSFMTWFAIALTSGMAIGTVFYGVAEPMTYFMNPPGFLGIDGGTAEAGEQSLRFTFLHWTLHPYAAYTTAGICMALMIYNAKRRFAVSSALYPLIGEKTNGSIGYLIDALAIFTMVAGIACSFGLGTMQIGDGFNYVFHTNFSSNGVYLIIILGMAAFYILAACSGLHKGITYISNLNMYIYYALLLFILVTGGFIFILNNTVSGVGAYLGNFIEDAFYLEPLQQTGWVGAWSIYYWAWWISACLITGLFLVKLAKGRTLRQFVLVNMLAPSLFGIIWFGIFGGAAINLDFNHGAGIAQALSDHGIQVALFALLKNLPLSLITSILGFLAIIFSFVTLAEGMTLTLADMTAAIGTEEGKSPVLLKVFWGGITGIIAFALLLSGGLSALQTGVIVCGIPILILMLFMVFGTLKALRHPETYDLVDAVPAEEKQIKNEKVATDISK